MPNIIETIEEFEARHGTDSVRIGKASHYIYADGAQVMNGYPIEPPTKRSDLLPLLIRRKREQIRRLRDQFVSIKQNLLEIGAAAKHNRSGSTPEPAAEDVQTLRTIRDQVKQHEAELCTLQFELDQCTQQARMLEQQRINNDLDDQRMQRIDDVLNAVSEISLL